MDSSYWLEKWKLGDIAFHQTQPHPKLVRWFPKLERGKVLVPLCGKSPDLLWLRDQGHEVVGIELSPIACEAFFEENNLPVARRMEGSHTLYTSERIQLWCGDFFDAPSAAWAGCTAIYDRAAFVALPRPVRSLYAQRILERISPRFQEMLAIVVEYSTIGEERPPCSISDEEMRRLFGSRMSIHCLNNQIDPYLSARKELEVHEKVYSLRWKIGKG